MLVMALDTTTRGGSVALVDEARVIEERAGDASRSHAERLPSEITGLASAHRVVLSDVDLYAVAVGPGSFTGLRVGIATIQGLAFVHGKRVVGISALDALADAQRLEAPGTIVAAWMDAHRRDVFTALYRVGRGGAANGNLLEEIEGPSVGDPQSTLERWTRDRGVTPAVFVGDGAVLYAQEIRHAIVSARVDSPTPLLAAAIGRLAIARASDAMDPAALRPLYVRKSDAEIARDKK